MRTGNAFQRRAGGFTMLVVLAALTILGIMSSVVMTYVSQQSQRAREQHLIWVGNAYVSAIRGYHEQSPGTVKAFPRRPEDLLEDSRFVSTRRHLREAYLDPTNLAPFELIRSRDGGIMGVRSSNRSTSISKGPGSADWPIRTTYADWEFLYVPKDGPPR